MLGKDQLPDRIVTPRTLVRRATAEDLPKIAAWPEYPQWEYRGFSMTASESRLSDGEYWWMKIDRPDRCHYSVVLRETGEVIGVHALVRIDWAKATVGNMGVRIRADLCGEGYGTESLSALVSTVLDNGIKRVSLDVAAPNERAIRCYKKCGMRITGEFWRGHEGDDPDPDDPKWSFAMPHLRAEGDKWMVRFYWMEIRHLQRGPAPDTG